MIVNVIHQVVIDESGYGANAPNDAFVFAGYVAPVDSWEDLAHLIDPIFNESPALTAHEFKKRARWRHTFDPRISRTIQAIRTAGLRDVRFTVPISDYNRWLEIIMARKGTPAPLELKGNCWVFAFAVLITELLTNYVAMDPLGKLEVIYDLSHSERTRLESGYDKFYEWATADRPDLISLLTRAPIPRTDDDFQPLRIADMLAWNVHRSYINGREHDSEVWRALNEVPAVIDETWYLDDLLSIS
jgi:hypothetical protein